MNIIEQAKAYTDGWVTDPADGEPWKPWDQAERIPFWNDDRTKITDEENIRRHDGIVKWEEVHGHDCRLKCYPEFGCQVIESYGMYLIQSLVAQLEAVPARESSGNAGSPQAAEPTI